MIRIFVLKLLVLSLVFGNAVAGEYMGDPEAGKQKATVCVACHGTDGNSVNPAWPKIAGQGQRYFVAQLKAFKLGPDGPRKGAAAALMYPMADALSDEDMLDLAAYFGGQPVVVGAADDKLVLKGEAIYRGGNPDFGSAACIGCHGPSGQGNPAAGFPALSGQHAEYVYNQLQAFHDGLRGGDANGTMRNMVRKMSNEEMRAVAEYVQGLN